MNRDERKVLGYVAFTFAVVAIGYYGYKFITAEMPKYEQENPIMAALIPSVMLFMGSGLIGVSVFARVFKKKKKVKAPKYSETRMIWVNNADEMKRKIDYVGDAQLAIIGMEFTISKNSRAVVFANSGGDASLYFQVSNQHGVGSYTGGIYHNNISEAAKNMILAAAKEVPHMQPAIGFPLVRDEHIRFLAITRKGSFSEEIEARQMENPKSPWYNTYAIGHEIIAGFRELEKQGASNG